MKKRLSLLMVLMMIVSLLPMSAFAAATPGYTTLNVDAHDTNTVAVNVGFVVPAGAKLTSGEVRFELDNGAKFKTTNHATSPYAVTSTEISLENESPAANVTGTQPTDNIIFANITSDEASAAGSQLVLRLNVPVIFPNAGDVNLRVVDNNNTGIGSQTFKIAVVKDTDTTGLAITVKDSEKAISFDGGELSQFEIKTIGTVTSPEKLIVSLEDDYLKFTSATRVVVDGVAQTPTIINNDNALEIMSASNAKSVIIIPVLDSMGRNASTGSVSVRAAVMNGTTTVKRNTAIIGKIVEYGVTMTVVENGKKEIPNVWGGEEATVKVTLKGPKGSFSNRVVDFTVEGADVKYVTATGFDGKDDDGVFKDGEFSYKPATPTDLMQATEFSFLITIETSASKDGVATITAAQRGWEVKADLAKITPKLAIEAEAMPVKKGEARETATVTITEAKAGLLTRTDKLQLRFDTRRDYTQFVNAGMKIEATNGMKFGDAKKAGLAGAEWTVVEFPITRQSSGEAAIITISGIKVLVDGSATDDTIKLHAQLNGSKVANTDYIKVVKEYALESILTIFTIGQTNYTVNGEAKMAASAPYIKNGRTMLPVRALAESLGLTVQWNGATKTATFTDDTKVAGVVIGAETMYVNGTPVKLSAPAELVNGTTFIELRSLATVFGVQIDWDAAAKQATVSK